MSSEQFPLEEYKKFFGNGQIREHGFCRGWKYEGERKIWHDNGSLWMHAFYKNGELESRKIWYSNGQLDCAEIFEEGNLIEETDWYQDGKIKLHKLNGTRKLWHRNGRLLESGYRRDCHFEGERKQWHENGNIKYHDFWIAGILDGEDRTWLNTGTIDRHMYYFQSKSFDFNLKKKHGFLQMKKILRRRSYSTNTYLISDLSKIV
jgi:antitoxin component YwqK of YwqJK toxin-antitoxin module